MNNELIVAILAGFGGMLGWGTADFFAKKTIDRIGSIASLVWAHLFGTSILLLFAVFQLFFIGKLINIPSSPVIWLGLLFFGTLQMIVYWLVYEGFGKGQVAVLNPVFASFAGVVALVSIAFLREEANPSKVISLLVIFAGILFISMDFKEFRSKKIKLNHIPGLKEVGAATVLAAFWTLGWDKFVAGHDWLSYAFFMYAFMTLAAYIISRFMKTKLSGVKPGLWKFLILIGLGEAVAYAAISFGYASTSLVSVVALISGAFSLPTIILARIFLKEKVATVQTIGTLTVILGIIILSIR